MNRLALAAVLAAGVFSLGVATAAPGDPTVEPRAPTGKPGAPTADEIILSADRSRNGWDSFAVDVTLTNFKNGKSVSTSKYQVLIKGSDKSLVKFADPQDKGKVLLMEPDAMWLYLPSASRPIRVTPLQRLSGSASNGDIAQTNFTGLYEAGLTGEEALEGKVAWVLDLTAREKRATYQKVRLWVGKEPRSPLKAEFRLTSGKVTKVALFEQYGEQSGRRVLRRQVIHDALRKNEWTVMEFSNYTPRVLPDKMFNKNYLQQL